MSFGSVYVSFSMPSDGGSPILGYTATAFVNGVSTGITATGFASPILFDMSLPTGVIYTFEVLATNEVGSGPESAPSNAVEPATVPQPPTIVSVTPGNGSLTIAFTAPTDDGGSPIIQYVAAADLFAPSPVPLIYASGPGSPIAITGLLNGYQYDVSLFAQNAIGDSAIAAGGHPFIPVASVPSPPLSLIATAGNAQASVSFTAPTSTGGSPIISYTVTPNPPTSPATFTAAAPPIICSPLVNETSYTFTAVATNSAGSSAASAPSNAVIPAAALPGAPTGVSATPGNAQATVTFTPPTNTGSGITSYTVTPNPLPATSPQTFTGSGSPIVCTNLTNGTPYTFSVVANTASGSGAAGTTPSSVTPEANVPSAPTSPQATLLTSPRNTAQVTFGAPTSTGGSTILSYTVTSSGTPPISATTTTMPPPTLVDVPGLTYGTSYTFTVYATNSAGNSLPSVASNAVTPATTPVQPTNVTATPGNAQATVNWTAPTNIGGSPLTSYTAFSGTFTKTVSGSPPPTTAVVTGLTNGTGYAFEVYATNAVGNSPNSAPSSTVVPYTVPGVATGLSASPGNAQATLYFNAAPSNGSAITGYTVYFSGGGIAATGSASPITITGLTNGTSYQFNVVATNAAGSGAVSANSNAVVPSVPPTSALVVLTSTTLPSIYQNEAYSFSFMCAGGVGPYNVTHVAATPNTGGWIALASTVGGPGIDVNGLFTGSCAAAETETITVSFADSSGLATTQVFTLNVMASGGTLTINSPATLPSAPAGGSYFYKIGITGGLPPYTLSLGTVTSVNTWQVQASAETHFLEGATHTAEASSSLPVTVTDTAGTTVSRTFNVPCTTTLAILGISQDLSTQPLPQAMKGNAYSFGLSAIGGTNTGYSWSVSGGALPAGLSISAGTIVGTPTASGSFNVTLKVTDSGTNTASFPFSLFVQPNCNVTRPSYNTGTGFFVYNGRLHDPSGRPFHSRGVNICHYDSSSGQAVVNTNANICRYSLYILGIYGGVSDTRYLQGGGGTTYGISDYINAGILPNVGVFYVPAGAGTGHTTSNATNAASLAQAVTYWYGAYADYGYTTSFGAVRDRMIMNIANEWGNSPQWQQWYPCVQANITNISGATIYFSATGNANPFANAVGLGLAAITGAGGVANQLLTATGYGGNGSTGYYITVSATIAGTYTSGGVVWGGAMGCIRAAGWTCPFSIDGPGDAGNMPDLLANAKTVANSDPLKNTIISFHGYNSMENYVGAISSITKANPASLTFNIPPIFISASTSGPYYATGLVYGVTGMTQINGQSLAVNYYGGSTNNHFTYQLPINTTTTNYSAYTGGGYWYAADSYYRIILSQLANLQMQGVCVQMEEYSAPCPPRSTGTAGPTSCCPGLAAMVCDAQFVNWTYWAIDDHNLSGSMADDTYFAMLYTDGVYNNPTNLTIAGRDIVLNPIYGIQYQTVTIPTFL